MLLIILLSSSILKTKEESKQTREILIDVPFYTILLFVASSNMSDSATENFCHNWTMML